MLATTLLIIFTSSCFAKEVLKPRRLEMVPAIDQFPWSSFAEKTGIDPLEYLKVPSDDTPETLSCTTKPGPDRLACPAAMTAWATLIDAAKHINIPAGQCRSATEGSCRTVVCAPRGDLSVPLDEVTGHMWKPVSSRCVFGGTGGIWQNDGSTLVIEMGHASK